MPKNPQNLHQPTYFHLHPGLDAESLGISLAARWPSGRRFGALARHGVGACPLLCRCHVAVLEILLHLTYHFHSRDYGVFDCCGMAFSKAGSHAFIAIVAVKDSNCTNQIPGLG
jgi:hypothetical protein